MARHHMSREGRYLLGGAALTFVLCMITGVIANIDAGSTEVKAQTSNPLEEGHAIVEVLDGQPAQDLYRRTGSGSDSKGQGDRLTVPPVGGQPGSQPGSQPSSNRGSASGTSSPGERFSDPSFPSSALNLDLMSVEFLTDHRALSRPEGTGKRPTANDGGLMKDNFRRIGEKIQPLFVTSDRNLPDNERSKIPPGQKPIDYGYTRSQTTEAVPAQLKDAVEWIAGKGQVPASLNFATWAHTISTSAESQGSGSEPSSGSPDFPATNVKFQMAASLKDRLLIAGKPTSGPNRPKDSATLPDSQMVAMQYASDLWHSEWQETCKAAKRSGNDIMYFMGSVDPVVDATTVEVLLWAATHSKTQADVLVFPGHAFAPNTEVGTVLLGTPFAQTVARMIVQHKSVYGSDRAIVSIRFWSFTRTGVPESEYAMMVTLSGVDGVCPTLRHKFDIESDPGSSASSSSAQGESGMGLEMQIRTRPVGNQGQARVQNSVRPGKATFQIGGDSSDSS